MFTSYHSIRSQERDTHPSVWKCCLNEREAERGSHGMETGSDRTFVCFTCICYQKPTLTKPSEHACSYTNTLTPQYLVLIAFSRD